MRHRYVVDANVLFSAFIGGSDVYRLLFSEHTIYLPDFALLELDKYKARILRKTRLDEREFQDFVLALFNHVTIVPRMVLSRGSIKRAFQLCEGIDEKDTMYVAVALELHVTLVTNDKVLYRGLEKRHFHRMALLSDVVDSLPRFRFP
jgi:predicted nucleic acid-binding protein